MHLGLVDGPLVPHNLIAQESPVPLPKFQMTPRPKILMSSGFKKRNTDLLSFSLKKSRQANFRQVPQGAPMERDTHLTGHFYISLYLKGPKNSVSLHVPQKRGPYGNRRLFQSLTFNISFGVPSKGALPPGSLHRAPK